LLGALAMLLESSGAALAGIERTVYDQTTTAVEAGLAPDTATAARARGAALSEDAVVALALRRAPGRSPAWGVTQVP
jgi:hypothetical protein